jgi:hypothetical protein
MCKDAMVLFWMILCTGFFSCSMQDKPQGAAGRVILSLSRDTVYTRGGTTLAVAISISDAQQLKTLIIRKGTAIMKDLTILPAAKVGSSYTFHYTLQQTDAAQFNFSFSATGTGGKVYDTKFLHVDSRMGLLPVSLQMVARETGRSLTTDSVPAPNKTAEKYDVGCTDLGIMWKMGNGHIGIFFGDTQGNDFIPSAGGGGHGSNWRSNVLAFSDHTDLSKGLIFSSMATEKGNPSIARQIVYSPHITDGTGSYSAIPTAAIHANGADYVAYMDVKSWGDPGKWTTNFSGLYTSADDGQNWQACPEIRFSANSHFSQVCFATKDGYVYMIGTVSGRFGAAYLARFPESDMLHQQDYTYWNAASGWVKNDESAATPLFAAPVGELSLTYNSRFKRWIVTYLDVNRGAIVLRDAEEITGEWSAEHTLVKSKDYPGLYGGFIYPAESNDDVLYFTMSLWYPYNVFLMKAKLKLIK